MEEEYKNISGLASRSGKKLHAFFWVKRTGMGIRPVRK